MGKIRDRGGKRTVAGREPWREENRGGERTIAVMPWGGNGLCGYQGELGRETCVGKCASET